MLRLREIETEKSDKFLGKTSFWEKKEKTKRSQEKSQREGCRNQSPNLR